MYLEPSPRPKKTKNFDRISEYVIKGKAFKSWNLDPAFKEKGHNALYFRYKRPHKVRVEFVVPEVDGKKTPYGIVDVVRWLPKTPSFEIRPTTLQSPYLEGDTSFDFYVHSFDRETGEGHFEPRVYPGFHNVEAIRVSRLLTLKRNEECEYTLFLIGRAREMLDLAEQKWREGDSGLSNYFARFAIEFSLKSIFSALGVPFKLKHHPKIDRNLHKRIRKKLSGFQLSKLLWASQKYSQPSRMDFYGDEVGFEPSNSFIDPDEAIKAVQHARFCYKQASLFADSVLRV